MNSKSNFIGATMLVLLSAYPLGAAVAADEQAAHQQAGDAGAAASADAMAGMQKMREQMAAIRATKDPKERARLMEEHMQVMQSTMRQMRQDSGCMMMGDGTGMMSRQGAGGMNMMQMMMEQMQQHQEAMRGAGK